MSKEENFMSDIWAMILNADKRVREWKIGVSLDNGWCFHACGSKYVGTVKIKSEIEKGTNLIIFHINFIEDANPCKELLLADVTVRDMSRVAQDNGSSIPDDAIERFKYEFGFV